MSIIEKAAKRLAEKRRSSRGVDGGRPAADDGSEWPEELESPQHDTLPEAVEPGVPAERQPSAGVAGAAPDSGVQATPESEEPEPAFSAIERSQAVGKARQNWTPFDGGEPLTGQMGREDQAGDGSGGMEGWQPDDSRSWSGHEDQEGGGEEVPFGEMGSGIEVVELDADSLIRVTALDPDTTLMPEGGRTRMAEEFRVIKRPLLMKAFAKGGKAQKHSNLIMMSSSIQSEGKTFVSLNLAISIAMEMDSTVLLVDADVAKPGLSKRLGVPQRPGLIERLTEEQTELSDLLIRTDIPKLTVLPAGERHKRSTELLASNTMAALLEELSSRYSDRIVLFDSPPLLESTEAAVLASQMGQVVLVVESSGTSRMLVKEALSLLDSLDNVSFVLNKVMGSAIAKKLSGYGYSYGYGYYGEPKDK